MLALSAGIHVCLGIQYIHNFKTNKKRAAGDVTSHTLAPFWETVNKSMEIDTYY